MSSELTFPACEEPCPHCWDEGSMRTPTRGVDVIQKVDCAYCHHTAEHGDGLYVCLKCFEGVCRGHVAKHHALTGHPLMMRIKKTRGRREDLPTTLAEIGVEPPPAFDTGLICCGCDCAPPADVGLTIEVCQGIMDALTPAEQAAGQGEVDPWQFNQPCQHCGSFMPEVPAVERRFSPTQGPRVDQPCSVEGCGNCQNNWMCLTCGFVGCPRVESGGKGHGMEHFKQTDHMLMVKLGTVTPKGADLHCYQCDDEVKDPLLKERLAALGIDMATAKKTAKSLMEMQIDATLAHDFNSITEDSAKLDPAFGRGHVGLRNFGNTCYIASVMQALLAAPAFADRFVPSDAGGKRPSHQAACSSKTPRECYGCVLEKVARDVAGDAPAFSKPVPAEMASRVAARGAEEKPLPEATLHAELNGATPVDFKRWVAGDHPAFSSGEQQDAEEFLRHLVTAIQRGELKLAKAEGAAGDADLLRPLVPRAAPTNALEFASVERTACVRCASVKYRTSVLATLSLPIPAEPAAPGSETRPSTTLDAMLTAFLQPSPIEGVRCDGCGGAPSLWHQTTRMATFPEVLVVHARRQYLCRQTYEAKKLDVDVDVPMRLDLERLRAAGPAPGEKVVADEVIGAAGSAAPLAVAPQPVDETALVTLISMGIEQPTAEWALRNTNNDAQRAVDFVFSHPEGPPSTVAADEDSPSQSQPPADPKAAVRTLDGAPQYELYALVSHIGANAHTGHYVAHVRKAPAEGGAPRWVIFNDEKVALSKAPPLKLATMYFYRRCA